MIYLATVASPIVADGTTATQQWSKTRTSSDYAIVAAFGTWGSGTVVVQHQLIDGNTNSWVTIASLTSAAPFLMKQCPNGNYRATLSGATGPSLTILLKPL